MTHLKGLIIENQSNQWLYFILIVSILVVILSIWVYYKRKSEEELESMIKLDLYLNHGDIPNTDQYHDIYDIKNIMKVQNFDFDEDLDDLDDALLEIISAKRKMEIGQEIARAKADEEVKIKVGFNFMGNLSLRKIKMRYRSLV